MQSPTGNREISLIRIENSGKIPLTGISLQVELSDGQIEGSAINQGSGLKPKVDTTPSRFTATIERMLPTDAITASVMIVSNAPHPPLRLALRSNEALGEEGAVSTATPSKQLIPVALSMLGAGMAGLVLLSYRRLSLTGYSDRSDVVSFVLCLSRAFPDLNELLASDHNISYFRAGDLLLCRGNGGGEEIKNRCIIGLNALLSADPGMLASSAKSIRINLARLGKEISEEDYNAMRKRAATMSYFDVREMIWRMFQEV